MAQFYLYSPSRLLASFGSDENLMILRVLKEDMIEADIAGSSEALLQQISVSQVNRFDHLRCIRTCNCFTLHSGESQQCSGHVLVDSFLKSNTERELNED